MENNVFTLNHDGNGKWEGIPDSAVPGEYRCRHLYSEEETALKNMKECVEHFKVIVYNAHYYEDAPNYTVQGKLYALIKDRPDIQEKLIEIVEQQFSTTKT